MTALEPLEHIGRNEVRLRDRTLVHFSGCDYFRLARDPRPAAAAQKALDHTGLNVAASRRTTGDRLIYHKLESALAKFFRSESAVIVPDGYLAPLAAAQALAGKFSHAFMDELSHGALVDAAKMLGCPVKTFPHRDASALKKLLVKLPRPARPLVLTDGMFSHDGSVAPLAEYLQALPHDGILLVDDAHGGGLLGTNGRGTLELTGIPRARVIQCGTLSKTFGSFGGFILASRELRGKILAHSRSFIGATPLPPPLAGAAITAIKILSTDKTRRKRIRANTDWLRTRLAKAGWHISETPGPIIRLPALGAAAEQRLKQRLLAAGIYPPFLKYGAAAPGIFRFVISSEHTRQQLQTVGKVLGDFISRENKFVKRA